MKCLSFSMKRVILLIVFLILLQGVSALSFNELKSSYSAGDKLVVSGSSVDGFLTLEIDCAENIFNIGGVDVNSGVFSKEIYLTKEMVGDCVVVGDINGEEVKSNGFSISSGLSGELTISKTSVYLGEEFLISGLVKRLNGEGVNGVAKISLEGNGVVAFEESVDVRNGNLKYTTKLKDVVGGNYNVDVVISDKYGNEQVYDNQFSLEVKDKIAINAGLNKESYKAGDKIIVSGFVDKENVDIITEIDGKQFVISGKDFEVDYQLPKDTKGGAHVISVNAKDDYGNSGNLVLNYNVEYMPVNLELNVGESYNPGDEVSIMVSLFDQSGELVSGSYIITITQGWTKVLEEERALNEEFKLKLPQYASPGARKIKVKALNFDNEREFVVNTIKKLDISLEGDVLTITNIGNVPFSENLFIEGDGIMKKKMLYLDLGKSTTLDLSFLFGEGDYNINIPFTEQKFDGVKVDNQGVIESVGGGITSITGGVVFNTKEFFGDYSYYVFAILALVVVGIIVFSIKNRIRRVEVAKAREVVAGQRKLREVQQLKGINPGPRHVYGKATSEDVKDFKNRMVNQFRQIEKEEKLYGPRKNPDGSSGGLFSMFK